MERRNSGMSFFMLILVVIIIVSILMQSSLFSSGNYSYSSYLDDVSSGSVTAAVIHQNKEAPTGSITYTVDGKAYSTEQTAFRIADLPDGDYEVVVTVTDKAGNTAAEMVHVKKGTPPGVGGEEPEPSPETGDRGIPAPVLALLVSSGGTLIATGAVARRRKKRSGI